jgi:hypothetical protein
MLGGVAHTRARAGGGGVFALEVGMFIQRGWHMLGVRVQPITDMA